MTSTTIKTTPELRKGDVVLTHGMRVLIDGDPQLSKSHPGGRTYFHAGLVLNPDEVKDAGVVPFGWLLDKTPGGEPRWTVQGNELARWTVEDPMIAVLSDAKAREDLIADAASRMDKSLEDWRQGRNASPDQRDYVLDTVAAMRERVPGFTEPVEEDVEVVAEALYLDSGETWDSTRDFAWVIVSMLLGEEYEVVPAYAPDAEPYWRGRAVDALDALDHFAYRDGIARYSDTLTDDTLHDDEKAGLVNLRADGTMTAICSNYEVLARRRAS